MKALILIALLPLAGCGQVQRAWTNWTGQLTTKCSTVGTTIVQSDSGIAMLLDKESKTVPCK